MKTDDIIFFASGLLTMSVGLDVFLSPMQTFMSFGVINFGAHHQLFGAILIVFGVAFICSVLRKIRWK